MHASTDDRAATRSELPMLMPVAARNDPSMSQWQWLCFHAYTHMRGVRREDLERAVHRMLLQVRCEPGVRQALLRHEAAHPDDQEPHLARPRLWHKVPGADLTQVFECVTPPPPAELFAPCYMNRNGLVVCFGRLPCNSPNSCIIPSAAGPFACLASELRPLPRGSFSHPLLLLMLLSAAVCPAGGRAGNRVACVSPRTGHT